MNDVRASQFRVPWTKPGWVLDNTTNTVLLLGKDGRLELDTQSSSLPLSRVTVVRMAATLVMFLGLRIAVVGAVRLLRRKASPLTMQSSSKVAAGDEQCD